MLHVAFVWHMHQPTYRERGTGFAHMPWVRLHGVKDYLDMLLLLEDHPEIRQTFNLVPSLLDQVLAYADGSLTDAALDLLQRPASQWSHEDRTYALQRFFDLHWDHMAKPYPRYAQLLAKREELLSSFSPAEAVRALTHQDWTDLAVWFNLAWVDPSWRATEPLLNRLIAKDRGFDADDARQLADLHRRLMGRIVPAYRDMVARGAVELTTTPYYHPILPLLIDTQVARQARPHLPLPRRRFAWPEDARHHVRSGLDRFAGWMGFRPQGMWPSEQSVSPATLALLAREGVKWTLSDEGVLAHTLGVRFERDGHGLPTRPELLYRPYVARTTAGSVAMAFRDIVLSDRIGFTYATWEPEAAAADLHARLTAIARRTPLEEPLVTLALDGENCWEHYPGDGRPFLEALYRRITADPDIEACTMAEYLAKHPPSVTLPPIHCGSWIGSDYTTWIGEPTKNRAWELLADVRAAWQDHEGPGRDEAFQELLAAEGSDWFWWFGAGHDSGQDERFDAQFRAHLRAAWRAMGLPVPEVLDEPVTPRTLPGTDGQGTYDPAAGQGAMHQGADHGLGRLDWWSSDTVVTMRLDLGPSFARAAGDQVLVAWFHPGRTGHNAPLPAEAVAIQAPVAKFHFSHLVRITPEEGTVHFEEAGEFRRWQLLPVQMAASGLDTVEWSVPWAWLRMMPGDEAHFVVGHLREGLLADCAPVATTLTLRRPLPSGSDAREMVKSATDGEHGRLGAAPSP